MIKNYIKSAFRHLLKDKKFSFINIAGLTIGMAVSMLILNFVNFEFGYDKMHEKHERIYRAESLFYEGNNLTDDWATSSFGYGSAMKNTLVALRMSPGYRSTGVKEQSAMKILNSGRVALPQQSHPFSIFSRLIY